MSFKLSVKGAKWQKLTEAVGELKGARVHVGVLAGAGAQPSAVGAGIDMVELAAIHEFGAPGARIPERSFIRSTFQVRRTKAMETLAASLLRQVVLKGLPVSRALARLGAWGAAEVKNTIIEIDIPPPLAPATVDAKGSSKPLVDTGRLLNSISYEVK